MSNATPEGILQQAIRDLDDVRGMVGFDSPSWISIAAAIESVLTDIETALVLLNGKENHG
jgi:hypothetical protein